jgi:hypothetical protein
MSSYLTDPIRSSAKAQVKSHTGKDGDLTDAAILDMVYCAHFSLTYIPTRQGAPVNTAALKNLVNKFDKVDLKEFPAVIRTQVESARKTLEEHKVKGFVPVFKAE